MSKTKLFLINSKKYFEGVTKILKQEMDSKDIIYVSTNKPTDVLLKSLKEKKIDTKKMFFIDCISKQNNKNAEEIDNAIFIQNPQSLTALSIAINESIKQLGDEKKMVFFDSLSFLLIYNDQKTISKFSSFLLNKMKLLDTDMVMLAIDSDSEKQVVHEISSMSDEVKQVV